MNILHILQSVLEKRYFKSFNLVLNELNFWIFLLIFLQASTISEQIILGSCVFALLIIILNFFLVFFRSLSAKVKEKLLFSGFLFLMILLPQVIIFYLPVILLRMQLSIFLATIFLIFCCLIWSSTWNGGIRYSVILQAVLPGFLFSLLLFSLGFWCVFSGLTFFYIFFLFYNFSFIKKLFFEDWSPMILRSSFLWNFLRFFLPLPLIEEGLLFFVGTDFVISGIFGLFKVQGLAPKVSSSYARFLQIQPKPRFFYTGLSTKYLNKLQSIAEFFEKNFDFFIEEFTKTKEEGYPSLVLRDIIKTTQVQNFEPFLKSQNFWESREELHQLFLQFYFLDKVVVPSGLLFQPEAIPALNPMASSRFASPKLLLYHYFYKRGVNTSFIFSFKDEWFLGFSERAFKELQIKEVVTTLNESAKNSDLWRHNDKNLGRSLASFSVQDFLILNPSTFAFEAAVQSKSSYPAVMDSTLLKADLLCVISINLEGKDIVLRNVSSNQVIYSEPISDFKIRASAAKTQLIQSFHRLDKLLADQEALNNARFDVANAIIPRGAKPPRLVDSE